MHPPFLANGTAAPPSGSTENNCGKEIFVCYTGIRFTCIRHFWPMEQQLRLVAALRIHCGEEIFVCYTRIRLDTCIRHFWPMEQQLRLVAALRINCVEEIFVCFTWIR
jgi:hypothetical protein